MLNNISGVESGVVQAEVAKNVSSAVVSEPVQIESQPVDNGRPPYVSPAIRLDYQTQQVVLEFRDSESGEVERSIPSESEITAYSRPATETNQPDVNIEVNGGDVVEQQSAPSSDQASNQTGDRVQSVGDLGPDAPLGDGDTSSF